MLQKNNELQSKNDKYATELTEVRKSAAATIAAAYMRLTPSPTQHPTLELDYQKLYPLLYNGEKAQVIDTGKEKLVYLTFDDGPSSYTAQLLDTLDKYNVKATFFVVYRTGEQYKKIYKDIAARGHTIGIHTTSHLYKRIYDSVEDYLRDFEILHNYIKSTTGVNCKLFRFPGGSINSYNAGNYQELIAEMLRRGFIYYDWNVSARDTDIKPTINSIYRNVVEGVGKKTRAIVLMHDIKKLSVDAVPDIIEELTRRGYTFRALDPSVAAYTFAYK